jgi:hypothetical protein
MIDKASVFFVEAFHHTLLGVDFILVETFLRVCLVKVIGPATTTVDPTKEPIPFEKRIIASEASKIN